MSWTPDIWIKREDFKKTDLSKYNVWRFNIAGVDGFVLNAGELTSAHRELHKLLCVNNISHWILNGEGCECEKCVEWGEQVHYYEEE